MDLKRIIDQTLSELQNSNTMNAPCRIRFSFPISPDQAFQLLAEAYRKVVESRIPSLYDEGERALPRLRSIANWLTNTNCKPSLILESHQVGTGKTTAAKAVQVMARTLRESFDPDRLQAKRSREAGKYIPLDQEERRTMVFLQSQVILPIYYPARDLAALAIDGDRKGEFEAVKRAPFLILDDMGTEPHTVKHYGNEILPLVEVILYRYEEMLPTIITTNYSLAGIAEAYGPRISDRLAEMCEILPFEQERSFRR